MIPDTIPLPIRHWTTCRVCGGRLHEVLDLGPVYVSAFPRPGESDGLRSPLCLARCTSCHLVQLTDSVHPSYLYQEYWYRSGVNETMVAELKDVVECAIDHVGGLDDGDWVVDIGANDGTLLSHYPVHEVCPLVPIAYEPAQNLQGHLDAVLSMLGSGIRIPHAFPPPAGEGYRVPDGRAKIVTSIACFYDLDDPITFAAEVKRILHPEGVWIVQLQDLQQMIAATAFDNICHEHVTYLSLKSLTDIAWRVGLTVVDAERRAINGGSLRVYLQHRGAPSDRLLAIARDEAASGCNTAVGLERFAGTVATRLRQITDLVLRARGQGLTLDLYAASTKANTLLQVCGLDHTILRQAWERSPEKIGRETVKTRIPIVSEAAGRLAPPDLLLLGAWQFAEAFIGREAAFLAIGGMMLRPLPEPEVICGGADPAGDPDAEARAAQP